MRIHEVKQGHRWSHRLWIPVVVAVLTFTFTAMGGGGLRKAAAGADEPLVRSNTQQERVALTFDVTWGREQLEKILTVLDEHRVQATFFVGGTFLALDPDAVKLLAGKGHEVGTLGLRMVDLSALPEQEVTSGLLASQARLSRTLGAPVRFFRTPQGPATPVVVRGARAANLVAVTYSRDGEDHLGRRPKEIVRRVLHGIRKGDIIRLTASDWSPDTSAALPEVLRGLQELGLKVGTLAELVP